MIVFAHFYDTLKGLIIVKDVDGLGVSTICYWSIRRDQCFGEHIFGNNYIREHLW